MLELTVLIPQRGPWNKRPDRLVSKHCVHVLDRVMETVARSDELVTGDFRGETQASELNGEFRGSGALDHGLNGNREGRR